MEFFASFSANVQKPNRQDDGERTIMTRTTPPMLALEDQGYQRLKHEAFFYLCVPKQWKGCVLWEVPRRKTTTKNLPWTLTSEQLWQSLQPVLEAGKSVILQNQDQETTLSLDPWNWKIVDFSAYKILVHSAQFAKVISDSDRHVVSFYRDSKWTKDSLPKGAKPGKKHRFDSQVDDFKLLWWHRKFFRRQVRNSKCHFLVFNSASDFLPIHY